MPERPKQHRLGPEPTLRTERQRQRGTAAQRGYGHKWQKLRAWWIREHPLCAECLKRDEVTAATQVDHIIPHRGDETRLYDEGNLQSLCDACHGAKTARDQRGQG